MALNNPAPLSCQNIVSFDTNKTPNITAISGCNIGCGFCKCLIIKLIRGKAGSLCFAERCAVTNPPGFSSRLSRAKKAACRGCFFAERQGVFVRFAPKALRDNEPFQGSHPAFPVQKKQP